MVGIIILNYLTFEKTIECVDSVLESDLSEYRIYIVDNASPNESYEYLGKRYRNNKYVTVLKTRINEGFAKGNNYGIKEAMRHGIEYILLSNNDIVFNKKSIVEMYEFIRKTDNAVIVGPRIYDPAGVLQHSSSLRKISFLEAMGLYVLSKVGRPELDEQKIECAHKVFTVSGCCFMISASKFRKMGGFDENTFLYNEENILGCQAEKHNYGTYLLPSSSVVHYHGATTGRNSLFVAQELLKSTLYYWKTYRDGNMPALGLIFLVHTIKSLIKALYIEGYRSGWGRYFYSTIKTLSSKGKRSGNTGQFDRRVQ